MLLFVRFCILLVVCSCCLLPFAFFVLFVVCCGLVFVVCRLLCVVVKVSCLLFVVRCVLFVVWCLV